MNVTVYCGSASGNNPRFQEEAIKLARLLAEHGHDLVYGGSSVGLMGVVSAEMIKAGRYVVGVEPRFFIEAGVAQHELSELIEVETMSERKAIMIERGEAFVALPGGVGTLEEIVEIMSRLRLRLTNAPCVLINVDGFYDPLISLLKHMVYSGFLEPEEEQRVHFVESAQAAVQIIDGGITPPPHLAHPYVHG